jgi:hypothetical protein
MPHSHVRSHPLARHALAAALALAAGACAPPAAPAQTPAPAPAPATRPAPAPKPPEAVAAMDLTGQKVLVLPAQAVSGIPQRREDVTREVLFALGERDTRTRWIDPDHLRAALLRAPGYADDPDALPAESFQHHRERYMQGGLGSIVRRYSALMDTRLVLIPQAAQWLPAADGASGVIRLTAVMVDARSSNVIWYGEADGAPRPTPDSAALATAAAALAAAMVIPRQ